MVDARCIRGLKSRKAADARRKPNERFALVSGCYRAKLHRGGIDPLTPFARLGGTFSSAPCGVFPWGIVHFQVVDARVAWVWTDTGTVLLYEPVASRENAVLPEPPGLYT
jgi:hypothetical protein